MGAAFFYGVFMDQLAQACANSINPRRFSNPIDWENAVEALLVTARQAAHKRVMKERGLVSKYRPHQGANECARRMRG